jgi:hypothetical protein
VEPIMNAPLHSKTISEFWGRRWNSAFNRLAFEFISRPIARHFGARSSCDTALRSPPDLDPPFWTSDRNANSVSCLGFNP